MIVGAFVLPRTIVGITTFGVSDGTAETANRDGRLPSSYHDLSWLPRKSRSL
jgi:hypothetical protein